MSDDQRARGGAELVKRRFGWLLASAAGFALVAVMAALAAADTPELRLPSATTEVAPHGPRVVRTTPRATPRRVESGPIPDFAPVLGVATHAQGEVFAPELSLTLDVILGDHHVLELHDGPAWDNNAHRLLDAIGDDGLLWLRDYHPIYVRRVDGTIKVVRYLAENPNRRRYLPVLTKPPTPPPAPGQLFYPVPGEPGGGRWLRTEVLPLVHENGNLVSTGRWVFVTERLLEDNSWDDTTGELAPLGFVPRTREQIVALLARAVERPTEDIVVLPMMPHEATGHVDIFLLAVGRNRVVIPDIPDEALARILDEGLADIAADVDHFLAEQVAALRGRGIEVVVLPMLPPVHPSVDAEWGTDLVLYTPANTLLVRTERQRYALLPSLANARFFDDWRDLEARYVKRWIRAFRRLGWQALTVDAAVLSEGAGLLRCASAPIPK